MSTVVEHLANGLQIKCADGTVVQCQPIMLDKGMALSDAWDQRAALQPQVNALRQRLAESNGEMAEDERAKLTQEVLTAANESARLRRVIVKLFLAIYPELGKHITAGDVEDLLPAFFWSVSGASVLGLEAPEPLTPTNGTDSSASISPPGEPSPTPPA